MIQYTILNFLIIQPGFVPAVVVLKMYDLGILYLLHIPLLGINIFYYCHFLGSDHKPLTNKLQRFRSVGFRF